MAAKLIIWLRFKISKNTYIGGNDSFIIRRAIYFDAKNSYLQKGNVKIGSLQGSSYKGPVNQDYGWQDAEKSLK